MLSEHKPLVLDRQTGLGLFLLSAATLTFEVNLTRLFSVAQFYHFAFLIVSVALLGFGASGTFLALFPGFGQARPKRSLGWLALASGLAMLGSYWLTNALPFDSFSLAWDRRQVGILVLHYLALSLPFFFSGMATGLLLATDPSRAGRTYAYNLFGSAAGCLVALLAPNRLGGEGTAVLAGFMAEAAALVVQINHRQWTIGNRTIVHRLSSLVYPILMLALLVLASSDLVSRLAGRAGLPLFALHLSPYKALSYALQQPGSGLVYQRWNSFSRVDVIRSAGIHSLPGLSYRFLQPVPAEDGLTVDGDDLSPVLLPGGSTAFASYLPAAAVFQLRPGAETLVLEPRGGLDVLAALALGAQQVTVVEANPSIVAAAEHIYANPQVQTVITSDRSYLRRAQEQYDVIILSLASSYHPVRSGAYSLGEDYRYTVEAFLDALQRLKPDGLLVVTRWLQDPPSEELRLFSLAVTSLERLGADPRQGIVAQRGYNTATFFIKRSPFLPEELADLQAFAAERAFDQIYAPGLQASESNLYNVMLEPVYYQAFADLLSANPRQAFYDSYPFEVSPPTDDRPFFGHYFKWSQADQVLAELGKSWQPFGGAGYFVILALLALAVASATILVLLPVTFTRFGRREAASHPAHIAPGPSPLAALAYFGLIGLAYLLVEIPLIQRFILFLGHPAYAVTTVLFTLLLFSGLGSRWSHRLSPKVSVALLVLLLASLPFLLPALFDWTLGLPLPARLGLGVLVLAPAGFLMGIPFPAGIRWLGEAPPGRIPWVWAVNGAASVIASVLAALLALSFGFTWVFWLGALCYAGAWLAIRTAWWV